MKKTAVLSRDFVTNKPFTVDDIVVEHNIPVPADRASPEGKWTSLFERMPVGSSCEVPSNSNGGAIQCAGKKWALKNKNGAKFVCRKINGGQRLWRVA